MPKLRPRRRLALRDDPLFGRRQKPVSHAPHRQQVPRLRRIVLHISPKAHDEVVDGPRIRVLVQAPDFFQHGLARHRLSFALDQVLQDVRFHQGQRKYLVAHVQLQQVEMDRLFSEAIGPLRFGWRRSVGNRCAEPLAPAQQSPDARNQNCQFERLGQVIVGSRRKALQHVFGMIARRQHQGRNELPALPELRHHRKSVLARQHHVQHHHVEGRIGRGQDFQRRLPGIGHMHLVAIRFQVETQPVGKVLLVFYDKDSAHLAIGNCSTNTLPRPGPGLSAQARPPCRLATERTMYSPKPVPLTREARGPGTRWNRRNTRFSSVLGIPAPSSLTRTETNFPSTLEVSMVTFTRFPEYFTALSIRLETAARTSSASPRTTTGGPGWNCNDSGGRLCRFWARLMHSSMRASISMRVRLSLRYDAPMRPVRNTCSMVDRRRSLSSSMIR